MKHVFAFILTIILFIGCNGVSPNGDEEAVLVYKPWFFGHGGVDQIPVTSGNTWCALTTDNITFKVIPIQYKESFDDIITDDNNPVDFDIYIELEVIRGQSPHLYEYFGVDWYKNNVSPYLRKLARDKASQHKTFDLAGNREILNAIETDIENEMRKFVNDKKMSVKVNRVVMGKVTPPGPVLDETMKTAAQNQAILTQKSRQEAERARAGAEKQKAIADDMYKNTFGMTTEQYLHLRDLEIRKETVELLKDHPNATLIFNQSSSLPITYPVK